MRLTPYSPSAWSLVTKSSTASSTYVKPHTTSVTVLQIRSHTFSIGSVDSFSRERREEAGPG